MDLLQPDGVNVERLIGFVMGARAAANVIAEQDLPTGP